MVGTIEKHCNSLFAPGKVGKMGLQVAKLLTLVAGWSAVCYNLSSLADSFPGVSGAVPGPDCSSFVAELWAAVVALSAARRSRKRIMLITDNLAVVNSIRRMQHGVTHACFKIPKNHSWIW